MGNNWWKEKCVNRRDWMLDHLSEVSVTSEEALILLLIDFMNEHDLGVTHDALAAKLKKQNDDIDDILSRLTAKGFLSLEIRNGKISFEIDGVFKGTQETTTADVSLFDQFESEFARPLSQLEMQRLAEWLNVYHQKLILYALREALTYDKKSFDYIERILIEWKKRGLTPEAYEEGMR